MKPKNFVFSHLNHHNYSIDFTQFPQLFNSYFLNIKYESIGNQKTASITTHSFLKYEFTSLQSSSPSGLNSRIRDVCSLKLYNRKSFSQTQTDADANRTDGAAQIVV